MLFVLLIDVKRAFSQPNQHLNHEIMELQRRAQEHFDNYKFTYALRDYLILDSLDPNNILYQYPIGACYVQQENEAAIPYLEKCLALEDKFPTNLLKYAATAYHLDHQFEKAITYYEKYKTTLGNKKGKVKKKKRYMVEAMDLEIEMCRNGMALMKTPLDVEISNLSNSINSIYPDYGPILTADEKTLIFTSERPNTTGGKQNTVDATYNEDIYISNKLPNGDWSTPVGIGDSINTTGQDASVSISPDGRYLLVYKMYKHDLLHASGDLFLSEKVGNTWSVPKRLPDIINSPKYWEPSGSLSADDKVLVFSSDRVNGQGGMDIWYSSKDESGNWSVPKNVGSNVNTKFEEDSPWLHPDGKTLYFASNGHNTMGGFDIFYSRWNDDTKSWGKATNLGYPINSAHDDIHFSWSTDGKRLYFSATRKDGKGDKDIYVAKFDSPQTAKVVVKTGIVQDNVTKEVLEATILIKNQTNTEVLGEYQSNSSTGKFTIILLPETELNIEVKSDGYKMLKYKLDTKEFETIEKKLKIILLEKE